MQKWHALCLEMNKVDLPKQTVLFVIVSWQVRQVTNR